MNKTDWRRRLLLAAVGMGGFGMLPLAACDGTLGSQFRTAAGDNIKTGVQSIVTGLIDGVFAVVQPDPPSTN